MDQKAVNEKHQDEHPGWAREAQLADWLGTTQTTLAARRREGTLPDRFVFRPAYRGCQSMRYQIRAAAEALGGTIEQLVSGQLKLPPREAVEASRADRGADDPAEAPLKIPLGFVLVRRRRLREIAADVGACEERLGKAHGEVWARPLRDVMRCVKEAKADLRQAKFDLVRVAQFDEGALEEVLWDEA